MALLAYTKWLYFSYLGIKLMLKYLAIVEFLLCPTFVKLPSMLLHADSMIDVVAVVVVFRCNCSTALLISRLKCDAASDKRCNCNSLNLVKIVFQNKPCGWLIQVTYTGFHTVVHMCMV